MSKDKKREKKHRVLKVILTFLVIFLVGLKKKGYQGMYLSDPEPDVSELKFE